MNKLVLYFTATDPKLIDKFDRSNMTSFLKLIDKFDRSNMASFLNFSN